MPKRETARVFKIGRIQAVRIFPAVWSGGRCIFSLLAWARGYMLRVKSSKPL
jgi:hypothetical protein